jgi:hypothetical protein
MFIAMNRFHVKKGAEKDVEQVWLSRDTHLTAVPGFYRVSSAERTRARGLHALHVTLGLAEQGQVRGVDQIGSIPSCPPGCRTEQAAVPRPSAARRLRGPPDRASPERCGRLERSSQPGTSQPRLS